MKRKLHLKSILLAAMLILGGTNGAWGQELTAVTTETSWDFSTLPFTSGSAEGQFLQDNTIYVGAGITKNARAVFNATNSDYPNALGSNIIAFKAGVDGQVFIRVSSYNGNVKITDGTNEIKSYSRSDHDGGVSYLRHYFNVTSSTTYYIYASSVGTDTGVILLHFFPCANTTEPLSMTEAFTWDFTPTANRETIDFNGITWNNLYQGAGVKHYVGNNSKGVDVTRLAFTGACASAPESETTAQTICFKIPAYSKGQLEFKLSCYAAGITVKCGNSTTSYAKGSSNHNEVKTIDIDNSASSTPMNVWFYSPDNSVNFDKDQIIGLYYITWTPSAHTYTINAVDENSVLISEIANAKCMEGQTYNATGLPKVITKDGKYYVLNDGTVTNFATQTYTMGTENETKSIIYTEDASIVYFCELEDLSSTSEVTGNYSGGKGAAVKAGGMSPIITLPAGNYMATGAFCNDANNRGMYLRTSNSNNSGNVIVYTGGKSWTGEHSTDEFTLVASTAVYVTGYTTDGSSVNQSATLDYIIIRRTNVPVTITAAKYATYCSPYALDFSATGATVYKAKASGSTVTLTAVAGGQVPANTGIILYKDVNSDTEITPTTIASAAAIGDNELVGVTSDTEVAYNPSTGIYNYILQNQGGDLGFYKATGAKIRANRAYLNTAVDVTVLGAPSLSIVFDDGNITSIGEEVSVKSMKANDGVYYNLSGQRVAQPTKGLYIINGRKVIFK